MVQNVRWVWVLRKERIGNRVKSHLCDSSIANGGDNFVSFFFLFVLAPDIYFLGSSSGLIHIVVRHFHPLGLLSNGSLFVKSLEFDISHSLSTLFCIVYCGVIIQDSSRWNENCWVVSFLVLASKPAQNLKDAIVLSIHLASKQRGFDSWTSVVEIKFLYS